MAHLDIHAKAEIGKSLAGFTLGEKLQSFLHYVDQSVDGNKVSWNVDLVNNNEGVLLYKWGSSYGNGYAIFFKYPTLELSFSEQGTLIFIQAGEGYQGEIFDGGIKIGSRIGDIDHALVLDDTEDVHYLADEKGHFIEGIYFVAGGLELEEDPDAIIEEVRVYNYNLI
ncbi:hypothetical protein [Psychrobacter sp. JB385]|uniref:hypothetical protein n=1 Tax=Psychrobacter sp. JB385 TaxID=1434841 RepID=UPI00097F1001|nr:hypothetical protein [Psychrobacter sp. JB385]SJN25944.1 hypothetical protein CZ794_05140 [Psychrobacter sp. JB385]